jgi:putative SOS response-associated peptidase YedK
MCGRFTLHLPPELITEIFGVALPDDFRPRFNVAPSQIHPVVRLGAGGIEISPLKWGLIPHWAQDSRLGFSMFNARAETVDTKPYFRSSFRSRRCLVLSDGFYEWRQEGKMKVPFYISLKGGGLMPYAGLWDKWIDPAGTAIETFTIITCEANGLVGTLHDRMPVIIQMNDHRTWLNPSATTDKLKELLRPYNADRMTLWEVGTLVNNPRNDRPDCISKA